MVYAYHLLNKNAPHRRMPKIREYLRLIFAPRSVEVTIFSASKMANIPEISGYPLSVGAQNAITETKKENCVIDINVLRLFVKKLNAILSIIRSDGMK